MKQALPRPGFSASEGRRMTSVARNEECSNGLSNTSPFSANFALFALFCIQSILLVLARLSALFSVCFYPSITVPHVFNGFAAVRGAFKWNI